MNGNNITPQISVPMNLNITANVGITEANQRRYYTFTAPENGTYEFKSSNPSKLFGRYNSNPNGDRPNIVLGFFARAVPDGILYDSSMQPVSLLPESSRTDIDRFEGECEFIKYYYLNAGQTYYFEAFCPALDSSYSPYWVVRGSGSFQLTVTLNTPQWSAGTLYEAGQVISYGTNSNGALVYYTVLQTHTSMSNWLPGSTPSLYKIITAPSWSQPIGVYDAYSIGDEVFYNGRLWVSEIDKNVWRPGVHGWTISE